MSIEQHTKQLAGMLGEDLAMFVQATRPYAYAELGEVWLRHQTARLSQKHLQCGRHFRLEVNEVLDRAAHCVPARSTRRLPDFSPTKQQRPDYWQGAFATMSREVARVAPT
ncbi:hypothetical protein FHW64_006842 [Variovorax sp. Sphag1AA]|nr:hypothetical protein [Variovorax sp. Sphag1AA]